VIGQTVWSEDVVEEMAGERTGVVSRFGGDKVGEFGEAVDDHKDRVEGRQAIRRTWQGTNVVPSD